MKALIHASQLLTGEGIRAKDGRKPLESDLGLIEDGALVHDRGKIVWAGATRSLPKRYLKASRTDLKRRSCLIPGLVDCHTHLVFAGDRSEEFALRCGGMSYEEIAARGGGIVRTVEATRKAPESELFKLACERVEAMSAFGVRTIEIKSGYGLSLESELKTLKVIAKLKKRFPKLTFSPTFLGAHAFPKGVEREAYLRELTGKMLPEVARKKLADACDVFIDRGYFTLEEGRLLLEKAQALGLKTRVHADEIANTESAKLAADFKSLSADHLLQVSSAGIQALARSKTVAVLLPITALYLKMNYAPARKLIDAGAKVALSTDFNPGTSMCLSLPIAMSLGALYMGMTKAEIFAAVTYNAASALDLQARKGTLEPGMDADFAILPFERFEESYYRFGWTP